MPEGNGRVPAIAGNWKMYKTAGEGASFVRELAGGLGPQTGVEVVVAPPYTGLAAAVAAAAETGIMVSAQNMHWATEGAYTGEVAPAMLRDLGVRWVIIGHSERRQLFAETDEGVARKVRAAFENGLLPIMCVGETESERDAGRTEERLRVQMTEGLALLPPERAPELVVAYEPVWAIGTGRTATPEIAQEACAFVRELVAAAVGSAAAAATRILYGGSVRPDNIGDLMAQPDIDGALVGGASLDLDSFLAIVRYPRLGGNES